MIVLYYKLMFPLDHRCPRDADNIFALSGYSWTVDIQGTRVIGAQKRKIWAPEVLKNWSRKHFWMRWYYFCASQMRYWGRNTFLKRIIPKKDQKWPNCVNVIIEFKSQDVVNRLDGGPEDFFSWPSSWTNPAAELLSVYKSPKVYVL